MVSKLRIIWKRTRTATAAAGRLVLMFDHGLLGGEVVDLQPPGPGQVPLQLKIRPAVATGPGNTSRRRCSGNARIENVGQSQSCMVSKFRMIR